MCQGCDRHTGKNRGIACKSRDAKPIRKSSLVRKAAKGRTNRSGVVYDPIALGA